jgi:hypothetical protein
VVNSLSLEYPEEPFTGRIVTTMANRAHTTNQAVATEISLVVSASKLTASIGMQYDRGLSLTLPNRHFNGPDHHVAILPVMHRPANNQLAEQVENHTQKELAFLRWYLRDIRYPLGIRF